MPNETIYLNTKQYAFVQEQDGENFSQKLQKIVESQMKELEK